jgi:hypothetical protein
MIRNVSYNNKDIFREIDTMVGKPFSLRKRFKMNGTGSQRLIIEDASPEITHLLKLDSYLNYCNIELRTSGVIVRFRSILETYAWAVPFDKLEIREQPGSYLFHDNKYFITLTPAYNTALKSEFFEKLFRLKKESMKLNTLSKLT